MGCGIEEASHRLCGWLRFRIGPRRRHKGLLGRCCHWWWTTSVREAPAVRFRMGIDFCRTALLMCFSPIFRDWQGGEKITSRWPKAPISVQCSQDCSESSIIACTVRNLHSMLDIRRANLLHNFQQCLERNPSIPPYRLFDFLLFVSYKCDNMSMGVHMAEKSVRNETNVLFSNRYICRRNERNIPPGGEGT